MVISNSRSKPRNILLSARKRLKEESM
jgi:hypothetical protein